MLYVFDDKFIAVINIFFMFLSHFTKGERDRERQRDRETETETKTETETETETEGEQWAKLLSAQPYQF